MSMHRSGSLLALGLAFALFSPAGADAQFRRGDADDDGQVTLFDLCFILDYYFEGAVAPTCLDAADVNDDGIVDTPDAIYLLALLCVPGSPLPPAPGPVVCGLDPTADALGLCVYTSCAVAALLPNSVFIRGDCAPSLVIDIGDAVGLLGYLFAGAAAPPCLDACDANDDGDITIADAIYLLSFSFSAGTPPPPPFPACGCDPGDVSCGALDSIACASGPCP